MDKFTNDNKIDSSYTKEWKNKMMTLEKFKKEYNMAPYELSDFIDEASEITDCDELRDTAKECLKSINKFLDLLDKYEIEIG
jgi:hypothetical protein